MLSYTNSLAAQVIKVYKVSKSSVLSECELAMKTGNLAPLMNKLRYKQRLPQSNGVSNYELSIVTSLIDSSVRREFTDVRCLPTTVSEPSQFSPGNIVDFGGGDGSILDALGDRYNLDRDNLVLIDPKATESSRHQILSSLGEIEDNCVDLILLLNVLHHLEDVDHVVSEIRRVLRDDGILIIKEHDAIDDPLFVRFIELIHNFWYTVNSESPDPLDLMSRSQTEEMMSEYKLIPDKQFTYGTNNTQRLYFQSYIKTF